MANPETTPRTYFICGNLASPTVKMEACPWCGGAGQVWSGPNTITTTTRQREIAKCSWCAGYGRIQVSR